MIRKSSQAASLLGWTTSERDSLASASLSLCANCASEHGDRGGACSSPDALAVVASSEAPPFHPKQRSQPFGTRSRMWRRSVEDFQIEPVEVLGVGDDVHLDDPSVSAREARDRERIGTRLVPADRPRCWSGT